MNLTCEKLQTEPGKTFTCPFWHPTTSKTEQRSCKRSVFLRALVIPLSIHNKHQIFKQCLLILSLMIEALFHTLLYYCSTVATINPQVTCSMQACITRLKGSHPLRNHLPGKEYHKFACTLINHQPNFERLTV